MMRATRGLLTLLIVLNGAACGGAASRDTGTSPASGPRAQFGRITADEMRQRGQYSNLYDLVASLRPRWVQPQGPDSLIGTQGQVQVVMDGNRLGSVNVLRRMSPSGVTSIEWVAPMDAAARFGLNHGHGAIVISAQPAR